MQETGYLFHDVELHEMADQFPEMPEEEFASLLDGMSASGFDPAFPVLLFEDKVLDGRHRLKAARKLDMPAPFRVFDGSAAEAAEEVLKANVRRRHMTASQRGMAAAKVLHLAGRIKERVGPPAKPDPDSEETPPPFTSSRQAAAAAGVAKDTVLDAERIIEHDEERGTNFTNLVEQGQLSVNGALEVLEHEDLVERVEAGKTAPDRALDVAKKRAANLNPDGSRKRGHPAKYSAGLMPFAAAVVPENAKVLDPFGGIGGVFQMEEHGTFEIVCLEIEAPKDGEDEVTWDGLDQRVRWGDATDLDGFSDGEFDAVVTSPTYGNKVALGSTPLFDAATRDDYASRLGRPLRENSTAAVRWGPRYRDLHERAWDEAIRVLRPGGVFVLSCRDHQDTGEWKPVTGWHVNALMERGLILRSMAGFSATGNRRGMGTENAIGDSELIVVLDKPS